MDAFAIYVSFIPKALLLVIPFVITFMFIRENGKDVSINRVVLFLKCEKWPLAFLCYVALLVSSTVLSRPITNPYENIIGTYGVLLEGKVNVDTVKNVLMFIPYIFLCFQVYKPQNTIKRAFLVSAITSLSIELIQLICWLGNFQISDIIHNICGGMIGCGVWIMVKHLRERNRK